MGHPALPPPTLKGLLLELRCLEVERERSQGEMDKGHQGRILL